ncbi:carbamoyltransferase HypF [Beijerinckia mobilis]|uniref:carbamoyltransferase HypF n=1 Tax=Beijerinckia mobilis TaxID=231434 RepID=UPI00068C19ED|nr:carbamoyltransferase HypF [Beijerinckia mobilis]
MNRLDAESVRDKEPARDTETILVTGLVQGVGFRPFVWRLAHRLQLGGMVRNDGDHVAIILHGPKNARDALVSALRDEAPPRARVEKVVRLEAPAPSAFSITPDFTIMPSGEGEVSAGVVADLAICPACLAEIETPGARRYHYPFTNCTDCGPRFSILTALPYDRAHTTMAPFQLCSDCDKDYHDPSNLRFHAEPIACPQCGPQLRFCCGNGVDSTGESAFDAAVALLRRGGILALKGIGGYHLVCDATSESAVSLLRQRKRRPAKPFALMLRDLAMAKKICVIGREEADALTGPVAPILLARRRAGADAEWVLAESVAPGLDHLGIMLPYTPLHYLLIRAMGQPLVMSSGNRSGSPQVFEDTAALNELAGIADGFLLHDRAIARRLDDSVMMYAGGQIRVLRRGRGLAPQPLTLAREFKDVPPILAMGGDLKSAFCLLQNGRALLSHYIGDLDDPRNLAAMRVALDDYTHLFSHRSAAIAVDLHPDYHSSRLGRDIARERALPVIEIQHHHAHIAAVMAEQGLPPETTPIIGIALDGLGYGEDGTYWGAEILLCDYVSSRRLAHLRPMSLPGGDRANREPWRNLLVALDDCFGTEDDGENVTQQLYRVGLADLFADKPVASLRAMVKAGFNTPRASSAGRLFDAMAALLRIAPQVLTFEGEAAMALETLARMAMDRPRPLPFAVATRDGCVEIDTRPLWTESLDRLHAGEGRAQLAAAFHAGLAEIFARVAVEAACKHGVRHIALSGGVIQNRLLFELLLERLSRFDYTLLTAAEAPVNDGGLALGQAVIAAVRQRKLSD